MTNRNTANEYQFQLIIGLCLLVFFNISCFTIITSFTKSNFLTAIQISPAFKEVYDQRPYFFLYGISSICFIVFYLLYQLVSPKATFEHRIKRDILALMGCSSFLYLIPTLFPGFQQRFFPAAAYFVLYDILDDLIMVQTWTLINYCINIRESKRFQNLFLFSGGVAAFISGRYIVGSVPQGGQLLFLALVVLFAGMSYLVVTYIFSSHRTKILATMSDQTVKLKTLLNSQEQYRVIRSIIYITILVGVFNLFFKVLFDTQVNVRYPIHAEGTNYQETLGGGSGTEAAPILEDAPDPKTQFIGKYKAFVSLLQVALHLLFIRFFAKLWLNGRIFFSYPLLLIPNLVFILWVYLTGNLGYENLLFWGTVFASGLNELIRRVIFDSSYQLLIFSIPERLSNALRMYSRLLIKPAVIICICLLFVVIPMQTDPVPIYCFLLILSLIAMAFLVPRISNDYVASLRESVLRRFPIERVFDSAVTLETNYVIEKYRKAVAESEDPLGYLYILNIIRSNYSPDLNFILANLLEHEDREVRLEAVSVVEELGASELIGELESLFEREADLRIKENCLKLIAKWGPANAEFLYYWMNSDLPICLRKYVLAIVYRSGPPELNKVVDQEVTSLLRSSENEEILAGIWLVGELRLSHQKRELESYFSMDDPEAYESILRTASNLKDFRMFRTYIDHLGYEGIRDYAVFNENLAAFGNKSFEVISDMISSMIRSKSYLRLEKCLRTLHFIPSQNSVDFLAETLFGFDIPVVRKEALNCIAKIKSTNPHLRYEILLEKLPGEITRCKEYCRYYKAVLSWNPDSLLLIELARNIEHWVWILFRIMDIHYSGLAILDSYYRITKTSRHRASGDLAIAKSMEYLESLIKDEHSELLQLLEHMVFEDGFFYDVAPLPGPPLQVEDVYDHIVTCGNHWLRVSAIPDMPSSTKDRFDSVLKETKDMIPILERIYFLRDVPLFKGFSIMELNIIAQISKEVEFEVGHVLFRAGAPGDALYIILEGRVDIVDESGRRLTTLEPPRSFGEVALLDNGGRTATAICMDHCRILKISSNDFQEILEEYPSLYKNIVYILAGWLREEKDWSIETAWDYSLAD